MDVTRSHEPNNKVYQRKPKSQFQDSKHTTTLKHTKKQKTKVKEKK